MKNFKKVLALVLALVMALSINTVAFAEESVQNEEKAEILNDLGLFSGMSNDDYEPNLEGETDREQAMVMLSYAFDWDVDMEATSSFSDVSEWAEPYVAYAEENDVTVGIGDGKFGAKNQVSLRDVSSWIASELGYGNTWQNPTDAVDVGVMSYTELISAMNSDYPAFIRDDLVGIFYNALTLQPKDSDDRVIDQLVDAEKVDEEKAYGYFPVSTEGYTFAISVDDEDSTLTADGADDTLVIVEALKNGEIDEKFEGTVLFQSLKGASFAKEKVAFDEGIAKVQVTSMSSPIEIVDTIIATIAKAPVDNDLVGESVSTTLVYTPQDGNQSIGDKVFVTYAESDRASDIYVTFNKDIDFDLVKDNLADIDIIYGEGTTVEVEDVVKVSDNVVKLVLLEDEALPDNRTISVSLNSGDAFIESTVTFGLVDTTAPEAMGVITPEYRTVVAKFDEPVTDGTAGDISTWVLNGAQLEDSHVAEIYVGRDGTEYDADNSKDSRNYVTFELSPDGIDLLNDEGEDNLLQAYGVEDYAGITDTTGQNVATTQEFTFETPAPPAAPEAVVTMDSPEQFRVKFDQSMADTYDEGFFKVEVENGKDSEDEINWDELDGTTNYEVTPIGSDNDEYLIELVDDWTVYHDTSTSKVNYYSPDNNEVKITVLTTDEITDVKSAYDQELEEEVVEDFVLKLDAASPTIDSAEQLKEDDNYIQEFEVVMDEPVQINGLNEDSTPLTPSELQTEGDGIPTPTFVFVNEDGSETVDGRLLSLDDDDYSFVVEPKETLEPGEWTIYIRSISDDVGNTSSTVAYDIIVKEAEAVESDPEIVWADAHDNIEIDGDYFDIVHIQFNTKMSLDVLRSNRYTINGNELPQGVMVTKVEEGGTRVTLKLPYDFLGDSTTDESDGTATDIDGSQYDEGTISTNEASMLKVNSNLTSSEGVKLTGATEVELSYNEEDVDHTITVD
ncbi:MAG: S-layer homology domain-containing protein [Eubacteriales bacterium]